MKKILLLAVLTLSTGAFSQENLSPAIQRARQHRFELVQKQDELLEMLLEVPFEQRQYIFPLLSAKQSVPKKIKTHPEILVWKGKKPTRIADRFKDDEELIQYLPEEFYYFLAPEMWPQKGETVLEVNPNQILQNMMTQNKTEALEVMPEELLDIYQGLNILQEYVQKQVKQPDFPLYFENWMKKIPNDIQARILEKTGLNPQEFAKRTDTVAKVYRLYQNQKIPPLSPEQKLVQEYWSLIPFLFQKNGFSDVLNTKLYQD